MFLVFLRLVDTQGKVIAAPSPKPEPKPHVNNYVEATPEDVKEWQNGGDFFMTGKFDAMKLQAKDLLTQLSSVTEVEEQIIRDSVKPKQVN